MSTVLRSHTIGVAPLSRETLQERVFRNVTELILDGSFVPGEMVTVKSLAEAFGVSPMPVREALTRLTAANALTVVSGRSVGIPPLSREKLTDLRNVRVEVEALAAGWAVERCDDRVLRLLAEQLAQLEGAISAGDVKLYLRANYAFHFTIYRQAGSESLLKIIENLWLQISPYFNFLHGSYSRANEHHRAMLDSLVKRDKASLQEAVRSDIDAAFQVLMRLLQASAPPTASGSDVA